jgi:predicted dehydrogenase
MPESRLGVGIVGVSPVRGWAATAHIPALLALPNYEIRALSAHNTESARAAGELFGVAAVFSDHQQLVTRPDVDVVAVTVKVPHHRELVAAALDAGKAVYCEWPLGRGLDDARAMAALAAEQGAPAVVGLQARQAPAIEFVQELLRDGYVGEVLSTSMVGLSVPGNIVGQPNAYMLDKTTGPTCSRSPSGTAWTPSTTYEPTQLAVPAALTHKWPALTSLEGTPAYNVGCAYAAFAADLDNGTHTVPDFADAVQRHEVIAAIESSAATGKRVNGQSTALSRASSIFGSSMVV